MVERADICLEIRVKPYLTGYKGTHTDEHGTKSRRLTDGKTGDDGMRANKRIRARPRQKCVLAAK